MTLDDYRNIAVIGGVVIAVIVYITNSCYQYKQRVSDNALRYINVHDKLFHNEFSRVRKGFRGEKPVHDFRVSLEPPPRTKNSIVKAARNGKSLLVNSALVN